MLPKYVISGLMKAYHNSRSDNRDGFPIWDDRINSALSKEFGIYTNPERLEFDTKHGMTVYFDWSIQVWRVQ